MAERSAFFEGTGMPDPGWWEALWPDPGGVLVKVGLKPGMDVVDLCSGDGWFTHQIAKIARHVTAIDIDGKLLETARLRLAEYGQSNCTFVEGDAYDIAALVDRAVDFVFLANAFHGVPDKPRLATAVARALKPGGLFVIVNWHARPREENDGAGRAARPGNGAPHRSGSGQGRSATNGVQACSDCRCTSLSLRQYLRGECKLTR
jgi:SAM-dependent methyltransferase